MARVQRHGYYGRQPSSFLRAAQALPGLAEELQLTGAVTAAPTGDAKNLTVKAIDARGRHCYLKVMGHRDETRSHILLEAMDAAGVPTPEILARGVTGTPSDGCSYLLAAALPGKTGLDLLRTTPKTPLQDTGQVRSGPTAWQITQPRTEHAMLATKLRGFALAVIHLDLNRQDTQAFDWGDQFWSKHLGLINSTRRLGWDLPHNFEGALVSLHKLPQALVPLDLAPQNIIVSETAGTPIRRGRRGDMAVIDPDAPTHISREFAFAHYLSKDPYLLDMTPDAVTQMLLQDTRRVPPDRRMSRNGVIGALGVFATLEGCRMIAPIAQAVHDHASGDYQLRVSRWRSILTDLPASPFRDSAIEAHRRGTIASQHDLDIARTKVAAGSNAAQGHFEFAERSLSHWAATIGSLTSNQFKSFWSPPTPAGLV